MNISYGSDICAVASAESVFAAGESGPLWRVVEGIVRLDGPTRQPVLLALPGDLIGIETLGGRRYRFSATAFTACRLEPVQPDDEHPRESLLQQALLQHQDRSEDMAVLRTGTVPQRIHHLLRLMGLEWLPQDQAWAGRADAIRAALPALREVAHVVDAKTETVCRALAQLLPPRSRKSGPVRSPSPGWPRPVSTRELTTWTADAQALRFAA